MIYEEQARPIKPKNDHAGGRTDFGMNTVMSQRLCVSLRYYNVISDKDIFNFKKIYSYDRCTNSIHFNTPLLIIYLSAIETLICHREIELDRVYFLRFCTNYHT